MIFHFKKGVPVLFALLVLTSGSVFATDKEASELYAEGRKLYLAGEYYDAAKKFDDSFLMAKSRNIRANSLLAKIAAYRMCELPYREFQAIEQLLDKYVEFGNYKELVGRQFEIGQMFTNGVREPAFWALRAIPWLKDVDRTEEVLSKALKRSPYAPGAPGALLQLAYWYEMEGRTQESLETLRTLLKNHPQAKECKFALLALGNGLFELAKRGGDGDGNYIAEALLCFREFERRYPGATELDFAKRKIAASRDIQAENLVEMANYYRKNGRSEVASRYLARVMQNYPDSESAPGAEKELLKLDPTYLPGSFPARSDQRLPALKIHKLPEQAEGELLSPLKNKNHFLLPVPDLKGELNSKGAK